MSLPDDVRRHLADARLHPLWVATRHRLERNGIVATGRIVLDLDDGTADLLGGILGRRVPTGRRAVDLDLLDARLRDSAAGSGLVDVVTELTGELLDRRAARNERALDWEGVWLGFHSAAHDLGPWVEDLVPDLRRSGIVTRLGPARAVTTLEQLSATLRRLPSPLPVGRAALAAAVTGDAHGLDDGRTLSALVLRSLALRNGGLVPGTPEERRRSWEAAGVAPDEVSGTALVWNLVPPGNSPWAAMLRTRADLGLVTHLTQRDLLVSTEPLVPPGTVVWACENPQVLQGAAEREVSGVVTCTSGNPSAAWWGLFTRLLTEGAVVRYHGDFDWPGIRIARRLLEAGAEPWRFGAADYERAVPGATLPLGEARVDTPWDPGLATAMDRHRRAVHEESLLDVLLADLI